MREYICTKCVLLAVLRRLCTERERVVGDVTYVSMYVRHTMTTTINNKVTLLSPEWMAI